MQTGFKRKDILLRSGHCFNCLKASHKSRECDSRKSCQYCHRKHHQSICLSSKECDNPLMSRPVPHQVEVTQPPADGMVTATNITSACRKQPTVLLQTAQAMALGSSGSLDVYVCVLFDSIIQLSYVTEKLKRQLNL